MIPFLVSLAACMTGPVDLSVITDTTVVGMVATYPEVWPGDDLSLTITVADPKERGVELMVWSCTPYDDGCVEGLVAPLEDRVFFPEVVDGEAVVQGSVPAEVDQMLVEGVDEVSVRIWALACEPDLCPIIHDVHVAALFPGRDDEDIDRALSDPTEWMADLPVEGVSLSTRTLVASTRTDESRNQNPRYEARFEGWEDDVLSVDAGGELQLAFAAYDLEADHLRGYAYTTVGRMEDRTENVHSGALRFFLLAPDSTGQDQPQEGDVYVIISDERGGMALFHRRVSVGG